MRAVDHDAFVIALDLIAFAKMEEKARHDGVLNVAGALHPCDAKTLGAHLFDRCEVSHVSLT